MLVFKQSDRIILATIGTEKACTNKANFSPPTDFNINFDNRQELKIIEDYVLDLQVILPAILDLIIGVRNQFTADLILSDHGDEGKYEFEVVLGELNEYIGEIKMYIERSKNLKDRARSTAQLVGYILPSMKTWTSLNSYSYPIS